MKIKNRNGAVICRHFKKTLRQLAEDNRDRLVRADLAGAVLFEAYLVGANLRGANLKKADLWRADLRGANLEGAKLQGACLAESDLRMTNLAGVNFSGANLRRTNFWGANLVEANLRETDLRRATLTRANLTEAKLDGANIEFRQFPSIRFLSGLSLGSLSDELTLELMRRDAYAHPHPEKFDEWVEDKWGDRGLCPYDDVEGFWYFEPKRELYQPGPPQMTDKDLIVAICHEKGWKIV